MFPQIAIGSRIPPAYKNASWRLLPANNSRRMSSSHPLWGHLWQIQGIQIYIHSVWRYDRYRRGCQAHSGAVCGQKREIFKAFARGGIFRYPARRSVEQALEMFLFSVIPTGRLRQDRKTRKDSAVRHVCINIAFFTIILKFYHSRSISCLVKTIGLPQYIADKSVKNTWLWPSNRCKNQFCFSIENAMSFTIHKTVSCSLFLRWHDFSA